MHYIMYMHIYIYIYIYDSYDIYIIKIYTHVCLKINCTFVMYTHTKLNGLEKVPKKKQQDLRPLLFRQ